MATKPCSSPSTANAAALKTEFRNITGSPKETTMPRVSGNSSSTTCAAVSSTPGAWKVSSQL